MDNSIEQRREERLECQWPLWFAGDTGESLAQGEMIDVSSGGLAFTCNANQRTPSTGERLVLHFSVPRSSCSDSFDMAKFTRTAHICGTGNMEPSLLRVSVEFEEPLPFKPIEQVSDKADVK